MYALREVLSFFPSFFLRPFISVIDFAYFALPLSLSLSTTPADIFASRARFSERNQVVRDIRIMRNGSRSTRHYKHAQRSLSRVISYILYIVLSHKKKKDNTLDMPSIISLYRNNLREIVFSDLLLFSSRSRVSLVTILWHHHRSLVIHLLFTVVGDTRD